MEQLEDEQFQNVMHRLLEMPFHSLNIDEFHVSM